jgi:hypothetical protein
MQKGVAHAQTSAVRLKSLRLNSLYIALSRSQVRSRLAGGGRWLRTSNPPRKTEQTAQTILHPYCAGTELRSSPDSLPEIEIRTPRFPARKAGSVPSDLTP